MLGLASNLNTDASRIIVACLLLIVAIVVLSLGILWYRRRWLNSSDTTSGTSWNLDDLRNLCEQGKITEEEYRAMRDSIIGTYTSKDSSDTEDAATQTDDGGIT